MMNLNVSGRLDTVGVPSSILGEPTTFKSKSKPQIVEIPGNFNVVPAVVWKNGRVKIYRALINSAPKIGDFSVTFRRVKRRSA